MAAKSPQIDRKATKDKITVTWTGVTESDTFVAYTFDKLAQDISVHTSGTFGSATVVYKVANNGGSGVNATDLGGTAISHTAEAITSVRERPLTIQPSASGGSSQSLTVTMVVWL